MWVWNPRRAEEIQEKETQNGQKNFEEIKMENFPKNKIEKCQPHKFKKLENIRLDR